MDERFNALHDGNRSVTEVFGFMARISLSYHLRTR